MLKNFIRDEEGATLMEYVIIGGYILVIISGAVLFIVLPIAVMIKFLMM